MGFPHSIIPNAPDTLDAVARLIGERSVGGVVMGESLDFSGNENPIAAAARAFAEALEARTRVPVYWEQELFTSALARRAQDREAKSRAPKSHADVDASAAALILTSYLERTHGN